MVLNYLPIVEQRQSPCFPKQVHTQSEIFFPSQSFCGIDLVKHASNAVSSCKTHVLNNYTQDGEWFYYSADMVFLLLEEKNAVHMQL